MLSKIILVGVDGSQPAKKALEYAANLASKNDPIVVEHPENVRWNSCLIDKGNVYHGEQRDPPSYLALRKNGFTTPSTQAGSKLDGNVLVSGGLSNCSVFLLGVSYYVPFAGSFGLPSVPLVRKPSISFASNPSSFRISSLCSPSSGARFAGTLVTPCT
jgi:Universal stress protein family